MKKRFIITAAILACLALLPFSAWAFTYYIPYYENGPGIGTGIAFRNLSATDQTEVSVEVYDQSGTLVQQTSFPLAPNGQLSTVIGDETVRHGWIFVESEQKVAGLCIVGTENGIMDVPFNRIVSTEIVIPHIAQDDRWDTTAIVSNPNDTNANLTVFFFGEDGAQISQESFELLALGSERIAVADFFQQDGQSSGSMVMEADVGIVAFAFYDNEKIGGFGSAGIDGHPLTISNFDGAWTGTFTPLVEVNDSGEPCIAPTDVPVEVNDRTMTGTVDAGESGQFDLNGRIDTDGNVSGTLSDTSQGNPSWFFTGLNDNQVMSGDWEAADGCSGTWTMQRQ